MRRFRKIELPNPPALLGVKRSERQTGDFCGGLRGESAGEKCGMRISILKETVLRVSEQDRFRSSREREGGDTARRKVDAKREETVNALKIHMSLVGERGKKNRPDMDENVESWEYSISAVKKGRKQQVHPNLKQDQGRNALD
jgi:hypothetical protein